MDITSFIGLLCGSGLILFGNALEGGKLVDLYQPAAFIIVFGGTLGATLLQNTLPVFLGAVFDIKTVFLPKSEHPDRLIRQIVSLAQRARREGILSLEKEIPNVADPFFVKALSMAVDGLEPKALYESMETEMTTIEEFGESKAKVWEAFGGYAPCVGIIGAVLGLIHVMQNLSDPSKLGTGIAVAFVATVYGVGAANILALPIAAKLKNNVKASMITKEIMVRGVLLIQEGIHHGVIEEQLKGFLSPSQKKKYQPTGGGDE